MIIKNELRHINEELFIASSRKIRDSYIRVSNFNELFNIPLDSRSKFAVTIENYDKLNVNSSNGIVKIIIYGLGVFDNTSWQDVDNWIDTTDEAYLTDFLLKTLQNGYIFVGDGSGIATATNPYSITGYVTVGDGGQYANIKAALDDNKYNLTQIGNIVDNVSFTIPTGKGFILQGSYSYTVTISATITMTANTLVSIYDANIISSTAASFVTSNSNARLNISNSLIQYSYALCGNSGAYVILSLENCIVTSTSTQATQMYALLTVCKTVMTGSSSTVMYITTINGCQLLGSFGNIYIYNTCATCYGTATGNIFIGANNIELTNFELPNINLRSNITGAVICISNFLFAGYTSGNNAILKISSGTFTAFSSGTYLASGSVFNGVTINGAMTLVNSNIMLIGCTTTGLTIPNTSNFCQIIGGTHTTITINGNNNTVNGGAKCTSIALGAVTGCDINAYVDNEVTNVLGNRIITTVF